LRKHYLASFLFVIIRYYKTPLTGGIRHSSATSNSSSEECRSRLSTPIPANRPWRRTPQAAYFAWRSDGQLSSTAR